MATGKRQDRVFTLPGQEKRLNDILNDDMITIINKTKFPCPKEGVILVYVEYIDYKEEGSAF
jgi:hypothetical protein